MNCVEHMPDYMLESVAEAICAASGFEFGGGIGQGACKETYLATRIEDGLSWRSKS
jgi:hypothetical protein